MRAMVVLFDRLMLLAFSREIPMDFPEALSFFLFFSFRALFSKHRKGNAGWNRPTPAPSARQAAQPRKGRRLAPASAASLSTCSSGGSGRPGP